MYGTTVRMRQSASRVPRETSIHKILVDCFFCCNQIGYHRRMVFRLWLISGILSSACLVRLPSQAGFLYGAEGYVSRPIGPEPSGRTRPLVEVPEPDAALWLETEAQRQARHAAVRRARQGTVLLLHKCGCFAPENSVLAIELGLRFGSQAVEMDIRRTRDGVIVLFHDDRLERLLDGFGTIEDSYYEELLLYSRVRLRTRPVMQEPNSIPIFREVLQSLRDGAGLMMLDIKTPGIDGRLLEEVRQADMLDHVIGCNEPNSQAFRKGVMTTLNSKGSLIENRADMDPQQVRAVLNRPGQVVFLDDPGAAIVLLRWRGTSETVRPSHPSWLGLAATPSIAALEAALRADIVKEGSGNPSYRLAAVRLAIHAPGRFVQLSGELAARPSAELRRAVAWNLGMIAKHRPTLIDEPAKAVLIKLLRDADDGVRAEAALACGRAKVTAAVPIITRLLTLTLTRSASEGSSRGDATGPSLRAATGPSLALRVSTDRRRRAAVLDVRGHYASALGLLGHKRPEVTKALLDAFRGREAGPDPTWLGVDGAMAARALGTLRVAEAVPLFREALACQPPAKEPEDEEVPLVHWDLQAPRFVCPALAEIGAPEAQAVLESVIDMPATELKHRSPELLGGAAQSLMAFRGEGRPAIVARLLRHVAPQVRGAAIAFCLDQPDEQYRSLLKEHAKWAVRWWDVQHSSNMVR